MSGRSYHLSVSGRVARAIYAEEHGSATGWADLPSQAKDRYDALACAALAACGYRALQGEIDQLREALEARMLEAADRRRRHGLRMVPRDA